MAKVTNTTARTPLGVGSLRILIEPGQTVELTAEQLHKAGRSKVVRAWAESGMLTIEPEGDDKAEMARIAQAQKDADELRELEEAEAKEKADAERLAAEQKAADEAKGKTPELPKVPTPTPKK